ncbi:MAG: hypothetical protein V4713_03910 [Pseudomonadota bacterium]
MKIDCTEFELFEDKVFLDWLATLKTQVQRRSLDAPRWRMYAYQHGLARYVALDMFTDNRDFDIAMTICLTPGEAEIEELVGGQLDISLPSVIEMLQFTSQVMGGESIELQVMPWIAKPTT